jgi:hypothetical protein
MRRLHVVLGLLQACALVGFAISIVVNARRVDSNVGKPEAEAVIYAIFGVMFALTARGVDRGRKAARTPFALLQVFVLIAGYTFSVGTSSAAKAVGAVVLVSGVTALVSLLRTVSHPGDAVAPH